MKSSFITAVCLPLNQFVLASSSWRESAVVGGRVRRLAAGLVHATDAVAAADAGMALRLCHRLFIVSLHLELRSRDGASF
jgi:hypothetical protein